MWLRLADLSRILSGAFFREVHLVSEMGGQNGQNGLFCQKMIKMTKMAWFSKVAISRAI